MSDALKGLTTEQAVAVVQLAGADPSRYAEVRAAVEPSWRVAPQPPPPFDHRAHYDALKRESPVKAALYASEHEREIWPVTPPAAPPAAPIAPSLPLEALPDGIRERVAGAGGVRQQLEAVRMLRPEWELSNRKAVHAALKASGDVLGAANYMNEYAGEICGDRREISHDKE